MRRKEYIWGQRRGSPRRQRHALCADRPGSRNFAEKNVSRVLRQQRLCLGGVARDPASNTVPVCLACRKFSRIYQGTPDRDIFMTVVSGDPTRKTSPSSRMMRPDPCTQQECIDLIITRPPRARPHPGHPAGLRPVGYGRSLPSVIFPTSRRPRSDFSKRPRSTLTRSLGTPKSGTLFLALRARDPRNSASKYPVNNPLVFPPADTRYGTNQRSKNVVATPDGDSSFAARHAGCQSAGRTTCRPNLVNFPLSNFGHDSLNAVNAPSCLSRCQSGKAENVVW